MSDQPIHNPPSYYLLPDGTEIREMIRQARGDESTIEHLAQSIMEYAGRLGKKPGASRADDFRKIARCAIQGANVCEGRSVSDNGDPPSANVPGFDLNRTTGYVRRNRILHIYERWEDARDDISMGGWAEAAAVDGVQFHPANESGPAPAPAPPPDPDPHALATAISQAIAILTPRANCVTGVGHDIQAAVNVLTDAVGSEPAPTPAPPHGPERPSVALPVVFDGDQVPVGGVFLFAADAPRSTFGIVNLDRGNMVGCDLLGPIPSPCDWPTRFEGEWEGEEA